MLLTSRHVRRKTITVKPVSTHIGSARFLAKIASTKEKTIDEKSTA
jgi:hypothetical protein